MSKEMVRECPLCKKAPADCYCAEQGLRELPDPVLQELRQKAISEGWPIFTEAADRIEALEQQKEKDNALLLKAAADLSTAWKQNEALESRLTRARELLVAVKPLLEGAATSVPYSPWQGVLKASDAFLSESGVFVEGV